MGEVPVKTGTPHERRGAVWCSVQVPFTSGIRRLQGYLAHKKTPPPGILPEAYAWVPRGVLGR